MFVDVRRHILTSIVAFGLVLGTYALAAPDHASTPDPVGATLTSVTRTGPPTDIDWP